MIMFLPDYHLACEISTVRTLTLKAQCKNMHHNDTIIFHYMHCAPLSIFNVLTQPFFFSVSDFLASHENGK